MPLINKTNYESKVFMHLGFTLAALAVLVYFGIMLPAQKMTTMKRQIETERANLEKNYERVSNLRQISEKLRLVEPQLAKLDDVFIKKEAALDFITSLEKVADNVGVSQKINLAGFTGGNVGAKSTTKSDTVPIQLSSGGSFYREMLYLANLEALNYYINVKNLEISNSSYRGDTLSSNNGVESGSSDSIVGIQILADTYWQN